MSYIPRIDKDVCSAHGDCAEIASRVFRVNETAEVIGEGTDEEILEAAKACPALAIEVIDSETGETIYP